jgi:hypothetical protein
LHGGLPVSYHNTWQNLPNELYFKTEEIGEEIIEELGEDKIKLALGIE